MGNLLWQILSTKNSLWSEWVHTHLLRGRSIWKIQLPSRPSWTWRKILQARDWCRGRIVMSIGDGEETFMWWDYWLQNGQRPVDLLSIRTLTSTGIPWNAKVSSIIRGNQWSFPSSPLEVLHVWQQALSHPSQDQKDHPVWTVHPSGKYTTKSAWDLLRPSRDLSPLYHLIWHSDFIPRQAFILWLATRNRLSTMDRLHRQGNQDRTNCHLCNHHMESHEHLFFQCPFSANIWNAINAKAHISWPVLHWKELLQWATSNYQKAHDITHVIPKLILSTTVYHLWYERNNRCFNNHPSSKQSITESIFQLIRSHLNNMKNKDGFPPGVRTAWAIE